MGQHGSHLWLIQLSANKHPGRQHLLTQVLGTHVTPELRLWHASAQRLRTLGGMMKWQMEKTLYVCLPHFAFQIKLKL